jgi:O-antigen/teichoic acid export membrane protein
MAYRLSELTHLGIADPVAKVTFPAFAKMRERGESVTDTYLSALRMVGLVACVIGVILSGAAAPFTEAVFGPKWALMIGPLAVLGLWAAIVPVVATMGWLLSSTGHAGSVAWIAAIMLVITTPFLIVAAHTDATAVSWVIVGESLLQIPLLVSVAHRKLGLRLLGHLGAIAPIAVASAATWFASRLIANSTTGLNPILALCLCILGGVAAYVTVVLAIDRETARLALRTARRLTGRDAAASIT